MNRFFIINHQYDLPITVRYLCGRPGRFHTRRTGFGQRKGHGNGRTFLGFGLHMDKAVVAFDDSIRCRQPQAGAFADGFGRKEGLEDFILDIIRDARAVVLDGDLDTPLVSPCLSGRQAL